LHFISSIDPFYALAGLLVGALVGLTGVGGGSLMTPLLVLLFGMHPSAAVGTDLLYASVTKSIGTGVHGSRGTVDWSIVARLAAGSVPAAAATLTLLTWFHTAGANKVITEVLGAALIVAAIVLLFRQRILGFFGHRLGAEDAGRTTGLTVALGAILGILVPLSSVGAGAIGMTVLLILYPRAPVGRLVGSDIAHAVPLTLIAGTSHWLMGDVSVPLLASLLVGGVPGVVAGSLVSSRVSNRVLRPVLASTLALMGGKLMLF
jgi:uncharacterized membrane protein YfcA